MIQIGLLRLVSSRDELIGYGTVYPNGKCTLAMHVSGGLRTVMVYDHIEDMLSVYLDEKYATVEWALVADPDELDWRSDSALPA